MTDYIMTVKIPVTNVPDDISLSHAKVTSVRWLKGKIDDAELIKFEEEIIRG